MLVLHSISRELGGRNVLASVSFTANAGRPVGLAGVNGSGKSTLLRIIAGEMSADSGRIELPPGSRIGYLPQGRTFAPGETVAAAFPRTFASESSPEDDLGRVSEALGAATDPGVIVRLEAEYDDILARLGEPPRETTFAEIDLGDIHPATTASTLSGGEAFEAALDGFEGGALVVTHDRYFIERFADLMVEL